MRKLFSVITLVALAISVACNEKPAPEPAPTPDDEAKGTKLTLTSQPVLVFTAAGGGATITYTLDNPAADKSVEVRVDASWLNVADDATEGEIDITVAENLAHEERNATIGVFHAEQHFEVVVMQAAAAEGTTLVEANSLSGTYYAEFLAEGLGNYWVILTADGFAADGTLNAGSSFYRLDIFGELAATADNNIPDGTYLLEETGSGQKNTLNAGNSTLMTIDAAGEVNEYRYDTAVLKVQGHKLTLEATIEGSKHVVTYDNAYSLPIRRPTDQITTLKGDVVVDVEGYTIRCESYGDYWHCGGCNWFVELILEEEVNSMMPTNGINLIIDLNTLHADASGGIAGYYEAGGYVDGNKAEPYVAPGSFVSGVRVSAEGHLTGSLYLEYADGELINQAPLVEGTLSITTDERGVYTISLEAWDDATEPNKITLNWSGEPYFRS